MSKSIFTAYGQSATTSAEREPTKFIKLEDGKSIRVRVASPHDVAEYMAHGAFDLNIYPTPCIAPRGEGCPMCTAAKSGIEAFAGLYARQRYLFFFWDLDAQAFMPFDATKQQAKSLASDIHDYQDDLSEVAFTFKRTGTGTSTKYTLSPILKLSSEDRERFNKMPNEGVTAEMFDDALSVKSAVLMIADLAKAEFPVNDFFGVGAVSGERSPSDDLTP